MKVTVFSGVLTAAVLALAAPPAAMAASYAMYAGSGCKVFGATAWTDLQFGAAGVANLTSSPKNVICPLVKESEGVWDGSAVSPTNTALVHFHIKAGAVASRTTCNVYVSDSYAGGGLLQTVGIDTGTLAAGTDNSGQNAMALNGGTTGEHVNAMILCTRGPKAVLRNYYLYEQGTTTF